MVILRNIQKLTVLFECLFAMKHYTHLTVLAIWMSGGKSFHALTVAILNARSPHVMSLVLDSSKRRGASNDWIPFRFTYDSII